MAEWHLLARAYIVYKLIFFNVNKVPFSRKSHWRHSLRVLFSLLTIIFSFVNWGSSEIKVLLTKPTFKLGTITVAFMWPSFYYQVYEASAIVIYYIIHCSPRMFLTYIYVLMRCYSGENLPFNHVLATPSNWPSTEMSLGPGWLEKKKEKKFKVWQDSKGKDVEEAVDSIVMTTRRTNVIHR